MKSPFMFTVTFAQARKVWDPRVAVANQLVTCRPFFATEFLPEASRADQISTMNVVS